MVFPSAPSTLDRPSGLRSLLRTALFVTASLACLPRPAAAGVGQWTTHGPEGGSVSAIVIDPVAPNFIYVITSGGFEGAFRSVDHGLSWQHMNVDPGDVELALAVDPQHPSTVYATTEHGVFKSVDRGLTWSSHGPPDELSSVAVDPVTPSTVYAGSFFGKVYKSTDGGASWQATRAALGGQVNALAIDPATPETLYAGALGGGVFKSTDSGASWAALPGSPREIALSGLVLDPRAPGTLFAVDLSSGVFESTDSGAHWTRVYPYFDTLALALDPASPATLYVATFRGVERSQDGGATWTNSGVGNREVLALAVDPLQTSTLFAGTLGRGIFASADGARTWAATNQGLVSTVLSTLAIDPSDRSTVYAGSSAGDAFKTRDGGLTWDALDLPSNPPATPQSLWALAIDPATPTTVYAARTDGVLKSVDGGRQWAVADNGLPSVPFALAIDPLAPKTVYAGTGNGVFKSVDGGGSWEPANSGQSGVLVWALAIDPATPSTLYAATAGYGVFKSTDAGRTWIAASSGLSNSPQGVVALAIDPTAPSRLYACDAGLGLVRSTDAGGHWTLLSPEGSAFFGCTSLAVTATSATSPATVYAGSSGDGVLVSRDGGGSWSQLAAGLGSSFVSTLAVNATGTEVHAGTIGAGVFDYSAALPAPCVASDTIACLHGGRFAVGASFSTVLGLAGAGHLVPLTDDTAYVWFFSPTNVEAVLKVVDGCALGDHFWVFDAGLTDVQTSLTVTDMVTGIVRSYFNPQGMAFQPNQDTRAFPCTGGSTAARRSVSTLRP